MPLEAQGRCASKLQAKGQFTNDKWFKPTESKSRSSDIIIFRILALSYSVLDFFAILTALMKVVDFGVFYVVPVPCDAALPHLKTPQKQIYFLKANYF